MATEAPLPLNPIPFIAGKSVDALGDLVDADLSILNLSFLDLIPGLIFGGGGPRKINIPALSVPSNISDLNIKGAAINVGKFRDLGGEGGALNVQTGSVINAIQSVLREFDSLQLGTKSIEPDIIDFFNPFFLELARASDFIGRGPTASSPQDQVNRNQRALALVSEARTSIAQIKIDRKKFLSDNPFLPSNFFDADVLYQAGYLQQNPKSSPNLPFDQQPRQFRLAFEQRQRDNPPIKPFSKPELGVSPLSPLPATQSINITVNVPQTQTTLGPPTGILVPQQPAPPSTLAAWWQNILRGARVLQGLKTAIEFPFFIKSLFTRPDDDFSPFFSTSGDESFLFPNFPLGTDQQSELFPFFLNSDLNPDTDRQFTIKELEDMNITPFSLQGILSNRNIWIALLLGILIAYVTTRKRKL